MKLPLYCYKCDMLTGHNTLFPNMPLSAECRRCGATRTLPILRWIAGIALFAFGIIGATWLLFEFLKTLGILV